MKTIIEPERQNSPAVSVSIPASLRRHTSDQATVEVRGIDVGDVLESLSDQYPELGKILFRVPGLVNKFINVYLNEEDIRFFDVLETPVKNGDEISLIPAIAGG